MTVEAAQAPAFVADMTFSLGELDGKSLAVEVQTASFNDGETKWDDYRVLLDGKRVKSAGWLNKWIEAELPDLVEGELEARAKAVEESAGECDGREDYSFDRRLELSVGWGAA